MKDSKNIARIEALRDEFEKLRTAKIRVDADIERTSADHERFKAAALEALGTADEGEIRVLIETRYEENTADVDAFEALMAEIRNEMAQLNADGGQATVSETRTAPSGFRRSI